MELKGTILQGRELDPMEGRVVVEDGEITTVEQTTAYSDRIVLPAFVNAHTHLGDSIAKEAGAGLSLEELVAPPDGLKHRLLRAADEEELVASMRRSLSFMATAGTAACIEFREGGVEGVEQLRRAAVDADVETVVFGRGPTDVVAAADGYGASGANDDDFDRERTVTRQAGKPFAIHAGEVDESDVNGALDLDPSFLVHMVHPEPLHLKRLADSQIPVVLCPRSNLVTGAGVAPAAALSERTTLALGTDNVMLNSPSMFREMEFAAKLYDLSDAEILRMATVNGADIAGKEYGVVAEGRPAKLLVVDGETDNLAGYLDPVRAVVRRAGVADVERVIL